MSYKMPNITQPTINYLHSLHEEGNLIARLILGTQYYFIENRHYKGLQMIKHTHIRTISKYIFSITKIIKKFQMGHTGLLKKNVHEPRIKKQRSHFGMHANTPLDGLQQKS